MHTRRLYLLLGFLLAVTVGQASTASAQAVFINGFRIPGNTLDATNQPGANGGRFGFFSDIYYDPTLNQWWALSDRGPGGGLITYDTRLSRFEINVHPITGEISQFRVIKTIKFTDPNNMLAGPGPALNGLNPLDLNGSESVLGHSFDPEGLVIDPNTGEFIVADEYGPSVYVFDRQGRLVRVFDVPENLVPFVGTTVNYVASRDACGGEVPVPLCGANGGRQDNRGYEGLAVSPDGKTLYAVLQDPLIDETGAGTNNGRNSRNVRIVVYDNDHASPSYGTSLKQLVYQLELQATVAARINAVTPGNANATDPRQGRNIGVSAIIAINDVEFLVLERDNRGIGVDDPAGTRTVGSKRVFKINIANATDVTDKVLGLDALPAGTVAVTKSPAVFLDLQLNTSLPNGEQAEKWEGLTIGPRLKGGDFMLLAGNDNDYSVTQTGAGEQFDVYVDFNGNFAKCVLDSQTQCKVNPAADDPITQNLAALPSGYQLLPGVLHSFRTSALTGYVEPNRHTGHQED
jgi:hypothetical protein